MRKETAAYLEALIDFAGDVGAPTLVFGGAEDSLPGSAALFKERMKFVAADYWDIVATFTEPPDPQLSHLHVLNSSGQQVDKSPTRAVPGKPLELALPLPSLPNGSYTVNWLTVSKTDGHEVSGTFAFGVGQAPTAASSTTSQPTAPSPSVLSVVGKWGLYAGVSVLFAASSSCCHRKVVWVRTRARSSEG